MCLVRAHNELTSVELSMTIASICTRKQDRECARSWKKLARLCIWFVYMCFMCLLLLLQSWLLCRNESTTTRDFGSGATQGHAGPFCWLGFSERRLPAGAHAHLALQSQLAR